MPRNVRRKKILISTAVIAGCVAVAALLVQRISQRHMLRSVTGAVLVDHDDPKEQRPIPSALVTVAVEESTAEAKTNTAGYFQIRLQPLVYPGAPMMIRCTHPDYHPYEAKFEASDKIHLVRLTPLNSNRAPASDGKPVTISNPRIRYTLTGTTAVNIGSEVRTFQIENKANVPCNGQPPCSPDGKWKAEIDTLTLDTGDDSKQFRQVRVSCIGGPCAFTNIEKDDFSRGGRTIGLTVRNWADTVTYLVEAEVVQTMATQMVRYSYPVIFGRGMNFTLPSSAQGPSIEADIDGSDIVFPLGPKLKLSWADCRLERGPEGAQVYRCTAKPNYRFASAQ